jgi:NADPH-dependent curcumin reductase CurA
MSTTPTTTRAVTLVSRPETAAEASNFSLTTVDLPALKEGQALVKNTVMSVDPYMRGRMDDRESYIPPFQINEPLTGGAVGFVVESRSEKLPVGASVLHFQGWREYAVVDDAAGSVVDTSQLPAAAYLSVLGMTGLTAWVGLTVIGQFKAGETVFVSAAAGAVGSTVGQIAKLLGAKRVIGSAGGPEKVEFVKSLGFDAVVDYKAGSLQKQLAEAAPEGIDVYFDNVGGEHLEAALNLMNRNGRVAMCGVISQMNGAPEGPRNIALAIVKGLTIRGFTVGFHQEHQAEFIKTMAPWVAGDKIQWKVTEREGLDNAVPAFLDLFTGGNTGKMVVTL